jgi:pyruvate dehydrogenase E2 component (dihydrolipoamide acetyltransferase)
VVVPKAGGVTSTKAIVVRWLKQEGDAVKPGDLLVELETEKVSYELESPAAGVLLKIIAREAAEVPVGDPLCQIGAPKDAPTQSQNKGASDAKARKPKSGKVKK